MTKISGKISKSKIDSFLEHPLMARLATAVPALTNTDQFQPHNVPVWFYWDGKAVYISAFQSTRKLKEALRNPYIAVLVDVAEAEGGVQAVLMEGKCDVLLDAATVQEMSRVIYTRYMGEKGVLEAAPQSWIIDPENAIIRLVPDKIFAW